MRPVFVVAPDPLIKVGLQLGDRAVDPLAEGHPVDLVQHRLVETLNDAVRLWAFGLGAGVIHILHGQIKLVFVPLGVAAKLRASVGQHAGQLHLMLIVEGHHAVVQQVGGGERGLAIVEFGEGHLGIGVDEGLLVDAPDPLHVADVERVLGAAVARALALELAVASFSVLAFSKAASWPSVSTRPSWATLVSSALRRFFIVSRSWRCHTPRPPAGKMECPCLRISLATRIWPKAGCSRDSARMAASISGAVRFASRGLRRVSSWRASSPPVS